MIIIDAIDELLDARKKAKTSSESTASHTIGGEVVTIKFEVKWANGCKVHVKQWWLVMCTVHSMMQQCDEQHIKLSQMCFKHQPSCPSWQTCHVVWQPLPLVQASLRVLQQLPLVLVQLPSPWASLLSWQLQPWVPS